METWHFAKDENGVTHWWLEDDEGNRLDVTLEQFTSENRVAPYKSGRKGWCLTKKPSKRSQILIESPHYRPSSGFITLIIQEFGINGFIWDKAVIVWMPKSLFLWRARRDSNPRPPGSKPGTQICTSFY